VPLKLPAFGRKLWQDHLNGRGPRCVVLLVGDKWTMPKWAPPGVAKLAVKSNAWHAPEAPRFDWRCVAECTVLVCDNRTASEFTVGPEGWDSMLWMLADVRRFARDVLLFTSTIYYPAERPGRLAAERDLDAYAFCNSKPSPQGRQWPQWWPFGDALPGVAA